METVTIVRIEHKSGIGIWQSGVYRELSNRIEFCDRHDEFPLPYEETPRLYTELDKKEWFCAFKTIEQMNEWVTQTEMKEFIDLECSVIVLDVSEWQEGKHQILYTKESIISQRDISDLFK